MIELKEKEEQVLADQLTDAVPTVTQDVLRVLSAAVGDAFSVPAWRKCSEPPRYRGEQTQKLCNKISIPPQRGRNSARRPSSTSPSEAGSHRGSRSLSTRSCARASSRSAAALHVTRHRVQPASSSSARSLRQSATTFGGGSAYKRSLHRQYLSDGRQIRWHHLLAMALRWLRRLLPRQ